jgi:hypothetical protein
MGLIWEASWKSCGRFKYFSNNEFLLAFKSSRCFFQTSVATNVVGVINVFYLFGAGGSLEREGLVRQKVCAKSPEKTVSFWTPLDKSVSNSTV